LIPKGNTFYLDLDVDPDDQLDYYVSMFAKEGGSLVGKVYKRKAGTDPYKGSARVTRSAASNGDSVLSVEISRSLVGVSGSGQVIRYRWFSQYNGDTYDDAPNSGWYKLTI
jgi:hypothetical protein